MEKTNNFNQLLMATLGYGVVLTTMHGAFLDKNHQDLAPNDVSAKVVRELHTHAEIKLQTNRVLVDPKSLRSVRSEGDKAAERDGLRGNWDVYVA